MRHLIDPTEFKALARPISNHTDEARMLSCIDEAERLDVIPNIGEELFLDIMYNNIFTFDETFDYTFPNTQTYELLLMGGIYEDACGKPHIVKGLKATVAYYAYARLVRLADNNVTRYGFAAKQDEYSERVSLKEKNQAAMDARIVADGYLREILEYLQQSECECGKKYRKTIFKYGRKTFNVIGD